MCTENRKHVHVQHTSSIYPTQKYTCMINDNPMDSFAILFHVSVVDIEFKIRCVSFNSHLIARLLLKMQHGFRIIIVIILDGVCVYVFFCNKLNLEGDLNLI